MKPAGEGLCPEAMEYHFWLSLHEQLHYNPLNGIWTWKVNKKGPGAKRGRIAGRITIDKSGNKRRMMKLDQREFFSSRLAWFYMTMEWPTEIDHENRNSLDDRWINLREVTHKENMANTSLRNNPKTGRFERDESRSY